MQRPDSTRRLFGMASHVYTALAPTAKDAARRRARAFLQGRFGEIFQRRHDCIHNCDRPRVAPQPLTLAETVLNVIEDIEFLVHRCDEHINAEFREFLLGIGCSTATIRRVGY
jgi:hypothetical protein